MSEAVRAVTRLGWRGWAFVFGCWTLYGILSVNQSYLSVRLEGRAPQVLQIVLFFFPSVWVLAALTGGIVWLARRFRMDRRNWVWRLPLHLAAAAAFAVCVSGINFWIVRLISDRPGRSFLSRLLWEFDIYFFIYFVVVAITHAIDFYAWYRDRRYRAAELATKAATLETQLAQTHLQVLKMQLQPHFLFNTLHTISELVHADADRADRMVTRLGDLLRLSMDTALTQEVTLKQELEFLDAYLEIQQTRFGDGLSVGRNIDPDTLDAQVPNLILQPLVENAIRHGTARQSKPGRINVSTYRAGERLTIEIRDNGRGMPEDAGAFREGTGVGNTRARLEHMYGVAHEFAIRNRPEGGALVRLTIPFRNGAIPEDGAGSLEEPPVAVRARSGTT